MNPDDQPYTPAVDFTTSTPSPHGGVIKVLVGVILVLFLALIGLTVALLASRRVAPVATNTTSTTSNQTTTPTQTTPNRKIIQTVPTSNSKLELYIYEPTQNMSNTTINFAVHNKCADCTDDTNAYNVTNGFDNSVSSYLLDDNAGKKYFTVTDNAGHSIATSNCNPTLKKDQTQVCFVAFSKVPSGSKVSWIFSATRIDNITIP